MQNILEVYQKYCAYPITGNVQQLDFVVDINRLRVELFDFIIKNNFGHRVVSLRLPPGETDWTTTYERLETNAVNSFNFCLDSVIPPANTKSNDSYLEWHPELKNSYVASLIPDIEKLSGFKIGRVRLGWLMPLSGYGMHIDLDPMRLHIPIVTNKLAYIINDDKLYNFEYGKLYHLISTALHTAWNFGKTPRLHLIFSTYSDVELTNNMNTLIDSNTTKQNYLNHIANTGIDEYSIKQLLQLSINSANEKGFVSFSGGNVPVESQVVYEANQLLDLLKEFSNTSGA